MHILRLKIEWTAADRKELEARKTTEIDVIGHVLLLIGAVPLSRSLRFLPSSSSSSHPTTAPILINFGLCNTLLVTFVF